MTDWEQRYRASECVHGTEPCAFLREHLSLLPPGRALDVAMGEGRNALFLAANGWDVVGVDRSEAAVERARQRALETNLRVHAEVADLEADYRIPPHSFDLIIVFYYLQRDLFEPIQQALRPGGHLVYETYTTEHAQYHSMNPQFLLSPGELTRAFSDLRVHVYRELNSPEQRRAVAQMIAYRG